MSLASALNIITELYYMQSRATARHRSFISSSAQCDRRIEDVLQTRGVCAPPTQEDTERPYLKSVGVVIAIFLI